MNSSTCKTLEDVLAWAHATGGALLEVIVQDEYDQGCQNCCASAGGSPSPPRVDDTA